MAKKFRFRLETVLGMREKETEDARNLLGQAVQTRIKKEEQIYQARQYHAALLAEMPQRRTSVQEMESRWYHARSVQQQIVQLEYELQQLLEIENIRRAELSEAMKRQKALEKLKEKKSDAHTKEQQREEQNFLDEMAQRGPGDLHL